MYCRLSLTHRICISQTGCKSITLYGMSHGTKDPHFSGEFVSGEKSRFLNLTSVCCKQHVCRNLHLDVPSEVWYMLVSSWCYLRTQGRVVVECWFLTSSECTLGVLHMWIWALEGTFHLCNSPAVCCRVFDTCGRCHVDYSNSVLWRG